MSSDSDPAATDLTAIDPGTAGQVAPADEVQPVDDAADAAKARSDAAAAVGDAAPADDVETADDPAPADDPAVSDEELVGALEAVLLVVDSPVSEQALGTAVGRSAEHVRGELQRLAALLADAGSGIDLREVAGGWRFYTRDRFAPVVERFVLDGQQTRLSRAAMETLAVIAYRQPVSRARIAGVRGVNVDGVIRTLVARGLIEEFGTDGETGAMLYRTTELFIERLGLSSLEELPEIGPLLPEVDAIDDV